MECMKKYLEKSLKDCYPIIGIPGGNHDEIHVDILQKARKI